MEFQEALEKWLQRAQEIKMKHHEKMGFTLPTATLVIMAGGKKYIRIVAREYNESTGYVFCFIERSTGNVLKAASWNAPAKHARGNIYKVGREGITAYGAEYLR